jgi:hypothetical protein
MAVRDHHPRVLTRLAAGELHAPTGHPVTIERTHRHHLRVEAQVLREPEMLGVVVQVGEHLLAAREHRVHRRHRVLRVLRRPLRADQMR